MMTCGGALSAAVRILRRRLLHTDTEVSEMRGISVLAVGGVLMSALALSPVILAQDNDPDHVIKGRQANERELGGGYSELKDELAKPKPLQFLLNEYAGQIESLAKDQAAWYPVGTGPETGLQTYAKPEIWTKRAEFDELYKKFLADAIKLKELTTAQDSAGLKAHIPVIAERCIACHTAFKNKSPDEMTF